MLSRGDFREYVVGRRRGDSRLRGNDGRGGGNDVMRGREETPVRVPPRGGHTHTLNVRDPCARSLRRLARGARSQDRGACGDE